jgi:magnesium-protoporphyrin O-methyltransferase
MAGCCRSGVCEEMFNPRKARANLRRYRKKGLDKLEREMVLTASAQPLTALAFWRLEEGSAPFRPSCWRLGQEAERWLNWCPPTNPSRARLAQHKGIEGRSTFRVADVLEQPGSVAPADIVILNRVVCCSPDGVRLTAAAGKLAGRMLLVIYPRDRTVVRLVMGFMNGVFGVMGRSFRTFLHPPSALSAAAQAEGLSAAEMRRTVAWEFTAFRRRL